jgi:hypothetical protein
MATTETDDSDDGYSTLDLRQMDRETARNTLTVTEFERWEQLHELREGAEQNRERWDREDEVVAEITVSADTDSLGTEVDVFGNDLLVRANPDDPDLQAAVDDLEAMRDDMADVDLTDADALDALDDAAAERVADALLAMLDALIVKWDGTPWADLPDDEREYILNDARHPDKWGLDGLVKAWIDILAAIHEDREERMDVIESFRPATGRGRR